MSKRSSLAPLRPRYLFWNVRNDLRKSLSAFRAIGNAAPCRSRLASDPAHRRLFAADRNHAASRRGRRRDGNARGEREADRPIPSLRRGRPRRHGQCVSRPRSRTRARTGHQGAARRASASAGLGATFHRGSARRRRLAASGRRAGLRAGTRGGRRRGNGVPLLHDETHRGPHARRSVGRAPRSRTGFAAFLEGVRADLSDSRLRPCAASSTAI